MDVQQHNEDEFEPLIPDAFEQVEVEPHLALLVVDLVRLFLLVTARHSSGPEDLIVLGPDGRPRAVVVPDYLVPLTQELLRLAARPASLPLSPSEVTTQLLHFAGLLSDFKQETDEPFPVLEEFFAELGLPIDVPYAL